MNKIIIFDFNRTIYDPDKQALMPGCISSLSDLKALGFKMHLLSMAAESRKYLIRQLGLEPLFDTITLQSDKTLKSFENIVNAEPILKSQSFTVGDRVTKEIKFGNELGLATIWYRNGRFAEELPQKENEHPHYTVKSLTEIRGVIERHLAGNP